MCIHGANARHSSELGDCISVGTGQIVGGLISEVTVSGNKGDCSYSEREGGWTGCERRRR